MKKTLEGIVISAKMTDTVVVEVSRRKPHPIYKKLMKASKKFKVGLNGKTVNVGDTVIIQETKPISKDKNFIIDKVVKK